MYEQGYNFYLSDSSVWLMNLSSLPWFIHSRFILCSCKPRAKVSYCTMVRPPRWCKSMNIVNVRIAWCRVAVKTNNIVRVTLFCKWYQISFRVLLFNFIKPLLRISLELTQEPPRLQINKIVFIYNIQKALWILKPHDKLFIRPVVASPRVVGANLFWSRRNRIFQPLLVYQLNIALNEPGDLPPQMLPALASLIAETRLYSQICLTRYRWRRETGGERG